MNSFWPAGFEDALRFCQAMFPQTMGKVKARLMIIRRAVESLERVVVSSI